MRLAQGTEKARQVELAGAQQADLRHWHQLDPRPSQQGRINPGNVFQQGGQRQDAQVAFDCAAGADLHQAVSHGQLCGDIQAYAFGLPGSTGGVGDLAGADGQRADLRPWALQHAGRARAETQCAEQCSVRADQAVDAGTVEHMGLLAAGEEARQRYANQPGMQGGQVPEHPVDAIVQRQGNAPRATLQQQCTALLDLMQQLGVAQLPRAFTQGAGIAECGQAVEQ